MEIMAKEGIGDEEYVKQLKKFKEDPDIYHKPEYQIRRFIWRAPYYDLLSYQILEKGDVEPEKKEIKINYINAIIYCDYNNEVHEYLKTVINILEQEEQKKYNKK